MAQYTDPSNDLLWSDCDSTLVDTWHRFDWTDDLYVRRAIWSDLDWGANDIHGSQAPITAEQWEANRHGIRHETGVQITFMDGHSKFIQARQMREVGPDGGQIISGEGSITPKY